MTLIRKYIFKEFIRLFLTALGGMLVLYLCVDFLQRADYFIKYKATMPQVARYYLYGLPAMAAQSLPMAALAATLLSLGNLSRHHEIIAMRASGISLMKITAPVVIGGIFISTFGFFNNESLMPRYTSKANTIRKVEVEKRQQRVVFRQSRLWLRGPDNSIANIEFITSDREHDHYEMFGVNIYKLNPDYSVRERIRAGSLLWKDGAWRLQNSRMFIPSGNRVISRTADGEIYNIVESPDDLSMIVKRSEEMNFSELWDYVRRLKTSGYNATRYEVDLQGKLAFPLASVLMVMIAAPFSLLSTRSGGAGKSFAIALLIAFAYWAILTVSVTLGHTGALPPAAAAWTPNLAFGAAAFFVLMKMQRAH